MADSFCWRAEDGDAGARLDAYITARTELTRSRVAALIEEGQALVNGRAAGKAGVRLRARGARDERGGAGHRPARAL